MIKLSQVKDQELRRGITLVGPHRDDLAFYINGKEASNVYGSQGQQRTTALSLKLAEIELIHEEIGEYPLLLLDDVLSELDKNRQTQLIETFQSKVQTFITTTGLESVNVEQAARCSYLPCARRSSITLNVKGGEADMYIHLGGEKIIRAAELVAIFDISIEKSSKMSKQFVTQARKRKDVEVIGEEEAKSIVVTQNKIYYSPISSSTLKKRAHQFVTN